MEYPEYRSEAGRLRTLSSCLVFFHKTSSRSWPFTNRSLWHLVCSHIFIDNNLLMDKVFSHYIYLPAYLKLMNIGTTRIPNVRDNNLIDYYAFRLRSVWNSKVLRVK